MNTNEVLNKLIARIEWLADTLPEVRSTMEGLLSFITSLQQEQPEVDLAEELGRWRHNHFKGKCDGDYVGEYYVGQYLERGSQLELARHFYELGQRTKYQQDRGEKGTHRT